MPGLSRVTLPSEFQDVADARLLVQPEPGYFWARLASVAQEGAELVRVMNPLGPNESRKLMTSGADVPDFSKMQLDLDPEALASMAQYSSALVSDFFKGAKPKQVVNINRPVFTDTTYTESSRDVTRATISSSTQQISGEQVSITIKQFSGPYNNTATAVQPYGIEGFDAKYSLHDFSQLIDFHLGRDRKKFLDSVIGNRFVTGAPSTNYVYPGDPAGALSTDNSAFLTQGDRTCDVPALNRATRKLKELGIPTFPNGRYMGVLSTKQTEDIRNSQSFQRQVRYFGQKNPIFAAYIGTIGELDLFESTTNPTATANSTITVQLGVVFGPGAVAYAVADPCHVECDDNTNFGRRLGVLWIADEGFETIDNRFLVSLRSD